MHQAKKAFNTLYAGFIRSDDRPTTRLPEPARCGPFAGERLDPNRWEEMLDEYHRANAWNLETG